MHRTGSSDTEAASGGTPKTERDTDIPSGSPLDYHGPASGESYDRWREEFGRKLIATDFEPLSDGPIHRTIRPWALPRMQLAMSAGTPMKFVSTGATAELIVVLSNSPLRTAAGANMPAGGMGLSDASVAGSFTAQLSRGAFNGLMIDREVLLRQCPGVESHVGKEIACNAALRAVLDNYLKLAVEQAPQLDAVAQDAVSHHLLDLVTLLLGGHRDDLDQARERGLAAARLEAIKADVLSRLSDPRLSIGAVAAKQGISSRYVQRLFEQTESSFSEFVLEQRLLKVARELQCLNHPKRLISEIAYQAGFNDLSYFNQRFRARFGMTPSDMRTEAIERLRHQP